MASDRRAILQLLAAGRIDAAQAERLLTVTGADREAVWALAGCALMVVLARFDPHVLSLQLGHLFNAALAGGAPALSHALTNLTSILGGLL